MKKYVFLVLATLLSFNVSAAQVFGSLNGTQPKDIDTWVATCSQVANPVSLVAQVYVQPTPTNYNEVVTRLGNSNGALSSGVIRDVYPPASNPYNARGTWSFTIDVPMNIYTTGWANIIKDDKIQSVSTTLYYTAKIWCKRSNGQLVNPTQLWQSVGQ